MSEVARLLHRWSRQKARGRAEPDGVPPRPEAAPPPALPSVESLKADADFRPFMAAGVPGALRKAALRRLWRLDPGLAPLDGMNDYDENFNDPARALRLVRTAYRVGRGMTDAAPDAADEASAVAPDEPTS